LLYVEYMTDLTQTDIHNTLEEDTLDPFLTKKSLPNKKQVRLLFPYAERQDAKKFGAKWNSVNKTWYYPSVDGSLPEDLMQYKCHAIHIEYDDKEFWKQKLKSMKWDAINKYWVVNNIDYQTFLKV